MASNYKVMGAVFLLINVGAGFGNRTSKVDGIDLTPNQMDNTQDQFAQSGDMVEEWKELLMYNVKRLYGKVKTASYEEGGRISWQEKDCFPSPSTLLEMVLSEITKAEARGYKRGVEKTIEISHKILGVGSLFPEPTDYISRPELLNQLDRLKNNHNY